MYKRLSITSNFSKNIDIDATYNKLHEMSPSLSGGIDVIKEVT